MKPFSTYPEDRAQLMSLAKGVINDFESPDVALELAELVVAILEDEAVVISAEEKEPKT